MTDVLTDDPNDDPRDSDTLRAEIRALQQKLDNRLQKKLDEMKARPSVEDQLAEMKVTIESLTATVAKLKAEVAVPEVTAEDRARYQRARAAGADAGGVTAVECPKCGAFMAKSDLIGWLRCPACGEDYELPRLVK